MISTGAPEIGIPPALDDRIVGSNDVSGIVDRAGERALDEHDLRRRARVEHARARRRSASVGGTVTVASSQAWRRTSAASASRARAPRNES